MKKIINCIVCLLFISGFMSVSASAEYIDPSAVTYTAQAVAAVVVAIGALITVFRHKIVVFFKRDKDASAKREIHLKDEFENDSSEK